MNYLKINDRVVCLDSKDTDLIEGKGYRVEALILDGYKSGWKVKLFTKDRFYEENRFIKIEDEIEIENEINRMLW